MQDIIEKLQERDANTNRVSTTFDKVRFTNDSGRILKVDDTEYKLSEPGFRTLCEGIKLPYAYAKRCPTSLLEKNINYWFDSKGSDMFAALTNNEGTVRSFMNPNYEYVPSLDVVNAALAKVEGDWHLQSTSIDDALVKVSFTTDRQAGGNLNDITAAGISLLHSDSWSTAPRFDSYLLRLTCTNGQSAPVRGRKFRVSGHSSEEIIDEVGEFAEAAFAQLDEMLAGHERLRQQNVDNVAQFLARICRENKLPAKVLEALITTMGSEAFLATMPNSRVLNMYDIVQVLTWAGTHNEELSPEHREHLQMIAGSMSLTGQTRCTSCGSSVL